jgi:hypothetical protein
VVRVKDHYVKVPVYLRVVTAKPRLSQDNRVVSQLGDEARYRFMVVRDAQSQLGKVCDRARRSWTPIGYIESSGIS